MRCFLGIPQLAKNQVFLKAGRLCEREHPKLGSHSEKLRAGGLAMAYGLYDILSGIGVRALDALWGSQWI